MSIEDTVSVNRFDKNQEDNSKGKIDTVFDKLVLKYVTESGLKMVKQPPRRSQCEY
jgi:hypothetical protein